MNTYQAKRLPLKALLSKLGHEPQQEVRGECWYLSPFRLESEPSFKINLGGNVWFDFGLGAGGNVIDFALQYFHVSSVADALHELESVFGGQLSALPLAPTRLKAQPEPQDAITLLKIKPITASRSLVAYLSGRGIEADIAQPYVQALFYTRENKRYFSVGFPNRSGGYELRNDYFKGSHGRKDISLIVPSEVQANGSVAVFEGFMDFLSLLAFKRQSEPIMPVIVLNSVAMRAKAISHIRALAFTTVNLFLDNDEGGRTLTQKFQAECPGMTVKDWSHLYAGVKDVNDWLLAQRRLERS